MKTILMNKDMTKAILDGRKVQTRRVVKTTLENPVFCKYSDETYKDDFMFRDGIHGDAVKPKYQVGETIFVPEDFNIQIKEATKVSCIQRTINYLSDFDEANKHYYKWEDAKHMLKSDVRIFLKVTDVRVERLQDITLDDIQREGLIHNESLLRNHGVTIENQLRRAWTLLWNKTAPKGYKWEDNPYVIVYTFERVEK